MTVDQAGTRPGTDMAPAADKPLAQAKRIVDRYAGALTAVMPRSANAETFMGLAMSAIRRDGKLLEASLKNPESLIFALRQCAYLGHVPMRGQFALVAFNDRNAQGGMSIVGIEEYRGVLQRMFRAGGVAAIHAEVGRERDPVLRFNRTRMILPEHEYDEFAPPDVRGPLKVAYAWATMPSGAPSSVAWLPPHDIARRRASSRSGTSFWGPLDGEGPNTEAMWRKSALHALEPYVPSSVEYIASASARASIAANEFPDGPGVDVPTDVADWDGEVIEG